MLDQEPVECLFQFICSSNNHISRIEGLVRRLSSAYGDPLLIRVESSSESARGDVGAIGGAEPPSESPSETSAASLVTLGAASDAALGAALADAPFYAFPTVEQLEAADEAALRAAGFGYRAKFIVGAVRDLKAKTGGAEAWLAGLRASANEVAVVEELCSLPGVGPKVAACVALFSLSKPRLVPVDVHVLALAAKRYAPHLRNRTASPAVHAEVQRAFVQLFGELAGWAHNSLFVAEVHRSKRGRARGRNMSGGEAPTEVVETPPPKKRTARARESPKSSTPELAVDRPAVGKRRSTRSSKAP